MQHLVVAALVVALALAGSPPIPVIPTSFATDFQFSVDIFNGDAPLFEGHFAVDYNGLGGLIYFEDSPAGANPYVLQTSTIGHPTDDKSASEGFQFLSEGRCWIIGNLPEDYFHYVPLAIPPTALFVGNVTIDGYLCSRWDWQVNLEGLLQLALSLSVRYTDNAPLVFMVHNTAFFPFTFTIKNSRFYLNPSKGYFQVPAGPCANHTWNPFGDAMASPINLLKRLVQLQSTPAALFHLLNGDFKFTPSQQKVNTVNSVNTVKTYAPAPPALHQYFQADYSLGWGELKEADNWQEPNSLFKGHMAVDKETGGFYINVDDNQDADVPFMFSTNIVGTPINNTHHLTGYWFLHPGRCWKTPQPLANPDFPLQIPSNATFVGEKVIYGKKATLWQFEGSYSGYGATFQIAVSSADNSIIFIAASASLDIFEGNLYLVFKNFDNKRPDPSTYAAPAFYCYDPTQHGPPN